MAIVPQLSEDTADAAGDALFMFPDVPVGELWSGTTAIPAAEPAVLSIVTGGGQLLGSMQGSGSYGPWTVDHSQRLAISSSGMTPNKQYVAVWHADSKGHEFSTYPAPITTAVSGGTVTVPIPLEVTGNVGVQNFPAVQPVSQSGTWLTTVGGTVTAAPQLALSAFNGVLSMTGAAQTLPSFAPVQGVILAARSTNTGSISYGQPGFVTAGNGIELRPGEKTPILPVRNSNVLAVVGTLGDILNWLVT